MDYSFDPSYQYSTMFDNKNHYMNFNEFTSPPFHIAMLPSSYLTPTLFPDFTSVSLIYQPDPTVTPAISPEMAPSTWTTINSQAPIRSFSCPICSKDFDRKFVLKRHMGTHRAIRPYHCSPCQMGFYRKDIYLRHLATQKCLRAHSHSHPKPCI